MTLLSNKYIKHSLYRRSKKCKDQIFNYVIRLEIIYQCSEVDVNKKDNYQHKALTNQS